jgi:hypothetical protein
MGIHSGSTMREGNRRSPARCVCRKDAMIREEILDRYRHLRAISTHHHSAALKFLSRSAILGHATRLGLTAGKVLLAESEEEMVLIFDLALYTAAEGRSRALDRYARAAQLLPASDEARMLDALRDARFSIWRIEQRHQTAGLIVTDVLREAKAWLIDEGLEASAPEGMVFAGRLATPDDFAMTCGVAVPLDRDLFEEVAFDTLVWRRGDPEPIAQDPRFAVAIYCAAIDSGAMAGIAQN